MKWWALGIIEALVFAVAIQFNKDRLNRWLMGVFRDVGRVKAYRRRHGNSKSIALMTVLMKQDDPLLGVDFTVEQDSDSNVDIYTKDELFEYGSEDPLLLSIFGRIYDVTAGWKFYGPQGRYHMFPGRDVTYALSTGCRTDECLEKTVQDLNGDEKLLNEGKRWLSFFQLHDKYPYVGKLDDGAMEAYMEQWIEEAIAKQNLQQQEDLENLEDDGSAEKKKEPPIPPILN